MHIPRGSFRRHALATAVALALAGTAHAQLSTATIKGQISAENAPVAAGLAVTATNTATGAVYRGSTRPDGSYVLPGLAPGAYEIRVVGPGGSAKTEQVTLQVGETASIDLAMAGTSASQQVTIVGTAQRRDVRTSELGTVVSNKMIENLPQSTHNFLSAADLAPGVAFTKDGQGNTGVQSGAQNFDHVNVYIDGVGQKNNILRGGLTGQDSSRGNPFPQSAIAEYKVVTQNYKAEFDQVSSAAITAITKSGTNELHGDVYANHTGTNWRTESIFEKQDEASGVALPPSSKNEYGFSLGGPIVKDQVHFFFAYDGKKIGDSRQVVPQHLDLLPAGLGVVPQIAASTGSTVDNFLEHLLFAKIDAQLNDENKLSISLKLRREKDRTPEDRRLSLPGNDKQRNNDETAFDLKHEWSRGDWFSEARLGYEDAQWHPHAALTSPFIKYKVSTADPQLLSASQDVVFGGGSPDNQDRAQKGTTISEDLTWTGTAGHVVKGGAKIKSMKYDLSGTAFGVDTVETLIDTTTGLTYFDGTNCTGTGVTNFGADSDQCHILRAVPPAKAAFNNSQVGLYLQDDWSVTRQLELNFGLRYDVETNMLNNSYVTPADRVAALHAVDIPRYGITPPPGQTYAESLAKGGINIDDYISDGHSRKVFRDAFAPRLGASFDLFGDRQSVLFGGYGRSFDRTMANHALDELQKNATPGQGEIWLVRNQFKMPYADQLTFGLRQGLGDWNAEIAFSDVNAQHQFEWFGGNRDANGGWAHQSPIDPLWGGPGAYGTLVLGDFVGENRTKSVYIKGEKPYSVASGWGVDIAYTYSNARTTNKEWNNDNFDWTYGRSTHGWNPSTLVDKHRLVAAGVVDTLLPWDLTLAGKATLAKGRPRKITDCAAGWDQFASCAARCSTGAPA